MSLDIMFRCELRQPPQWAVPPHYRTAGHTRAAYSRPSELGSACRRRPSKQAVALSGYRLRRQIAAVSTVAKATQATSGNPSAAAV